MGYETTRSEFVNNIKRVDYSAPSTAFSIKLLKNVPISTQKKLPKDKKLLKRVEKIKQSLFSEKGQNET